MILGCHVFIRGLIHQTILRPKPKDILKQVPPIKEPQKKIMLLLASIIYHIVMGIFKPFPIVPNNQSHLSAEEKIPPGDPLYSCKISSKNSCF